MVDINKGAVAKSILQKLEKQGYSQAEIGRRTGISRGQVYNILKGRTGIGKKSTAAALESQKTDQRMLLLRPTETVWVEPANWRQRSLIGDYWNEIKTARETGDFTGLKRFERRRVVVIENGKRQHLRLVTDPELLMKLEDEHQLDPIDGIGYRRLKTTPGVKA